MLSTHFPDGEAYDRPQKTVSLVSAVRSTRVCSSELFVLLQ